MGGNPSGRSQTLLLASWLRDQISACSASDQQISAMQSVLEIVEHTSRLAAVDDSTAMQPSVAAAAAAAESSTMSHPQSSPPAASVSASRQTGSITGKTNSSAALPAQTPEQGRGHHEDPSALPVLSAPSTASMVRQVSPKETVSGQQRGLVLAASPRIVPHGPALGKPFESWESRAASPRRLGLPHSQSRVSIPSWQGLLPEESESLGLPSWADQIIRDHPDKARSVLSLLSAGFGVVVHQVAMHCFERGALMASLWNTYTAVMDAEVQSLEDHLQVCVHHMAIFSDAPMQRCQLPVCWPGCGTCTYALMDTEVQYLDDHVQVCTDYITCFTANCRCQALVFTAGFWSICIAVMGTEGQSVHDHNQVKLHVVAHSGVYKYLWTKGSRCA